MIYERNKLKKGLKDAPRTRQKHKEWGLSQHPDSKGAGHVLTSLHEKGTANGEMVEFNINNFKMGELIGYTQIINVKIWSKYKERAMMVVQSEDTMAFTSSHHSPGVALFLITKLRTTLKTESKLFIERNLDSIYNVNKTERECPSVSNRETEPYSLIRARGI